MAFKFSNDQIEKIAKVIAGDDQLGVVVAERQLIPMQSAIEAYNELKAAVTDLLKATNPTAEERSRKIVKGILYKPRGFEV